MYNSETKNVYNIYSETEYAKWLQHFDIIIHWMHMKHDT